MVKKAQNSKKSPIKKHKTGSTKLRTAKKLDIKKLWAPILAVAVVGGFFIYKSFAATPVTVPSEFIARSYTESLGRIPTQTEWNKWQSYYSKTPCNAFSLTKLLSDVYLSKEFTNLPYSKGPRLATIYRGVFSREPDSGGFKYWKSRYQSSKTTKDVLSNFTSSTEFKRLASQICNNLNYEFKGKPFAIDRVKTGEEIQAIIDAAQPGETVSLYKSTLVNLKQALLVKRGVTLTTAGVYGEGGREAYANMARFVNADDPKVAASPIVLMPGASVKNIWVDGRMWQRKQKSGQNNIRIYPTAKKSTIAYVRSDNTNGAQNLMAFGTVSKTSEYDKIRVGAEYTSDGYCTGQPLITDNLVINSANLQTPGRWADGIANSCPQATVQNNQVLDASDVGIITYRSYGALPQKSLVTKNQVLSAGNSVFAGINADPLSLASQQNQQYPECMTHETAPDSEGKSQPHCDFTGFTSTNNTLWSGPDTHYIFGISVGTRAWGFFKPDATTGSGTKFTNNGNGKSKITVVVPLYVSGMHNAVVQDNFTTGNVILHNGTVRKCKPSAVQLYNPTYAQNLNATVLTRSTADTNPKYVRATTPSTDLDKCI